MVELTKIESTTEAWENGQLGGDINHASVAVIKNDMIDNVLGLQMVKTRVHNETVNQLDNISTAMGIPKMALIRKLIEEGLKTI